MYYDAYILAFLGAKVKAYKFTISHEIVPTELIRYVTKALNHVHKIHGELCRTCQVLNQRSFEKLEIKPEDVTELDPKEFAADLYSIGG